MSVELMLICSTAAKSLPLGTGVKANKCNVQSMSVSSTGVDRVEIILCNVKTCMCN